MSDYEKGKMTKGTVKGVKLNVEKEKTNGSGSFTANIFQLETEDGDLVKYILPAKAAAGKYVAKLKTGDKVTVKTGGKFNSVLAVFQNDGKFRKGEFKKDYNQVKSYDPTGPIQGMILSSAANLVAAGKGDTGGTVDGIAKAVIDVAKQLLKAKADVDKLVVEALKEKEDDSDSDDNFSDDNTFSSNNKRNKQVDEDDDDDDFEDVSPY